MMNAAGWIVLCSIGIFCLWVAALVVRDISRGGNHELYH